MRTCSNFALSFLLLLVALPSPAQPARSSALDARRGVILSASKSRLMPGVNAQAYWTPTRAQVRRLEADLRRRPRADGLPLPSDLSDDYRQYVGVVLGGRRLIYVNGFSAKVAPEFTGGANDWHRRFVFVNDGGNDFFHVTYDPLSRRFTDFGFNGLG